MPPGSEFCNVCGNDLKRKVFTGISTIVCHRLKCIHYKNCKATPNQTLTAYFPELVITNYEIGCADYKEDSKFKAAT